MVELSKSWEGHTHTKLHDVLLVPKLAYNLLSVTAAAKRGKVTTFSEVRCDSTRRLVAVGSRNGSLYYLDCDSHAHQSTDSNGTLWHRRLGHLSAQGMQTLLRDKMVVDLSSPLSRLSVSTVR